VLFQDIEGFAIGSARLTSADLACQLVLRTACGYVHNGISLDGLRSGSLNHLERKGNSMRIAHGRAFQMIAALVGFIGSAAAAADADHGEQLAQRWCATCHVIDGNQKQASADVPPFAMIARKPEFTAEKLAFFLLNPHPKMPNFPLSRNEAADLAAYIGSLRK
jgi:mono/diheme cytochrome c family protein